MQSVLRVVCDGAALYLGTNLGIAPSSPSGEYVI